jgi:hypothetical protein
MVLTFQSATSNRSLVPIDLQNVFWRTTKLPKDVANIIGFAHSIGGTKNPVVEKNASGKITGDRNKKIKRVDVRFTFKGGFASVRENSVTISGSVPWEMTYRVLVRLLPEAKQLTFKVTNTAVRFYLKKEVNLEGIYREKSKGPGFRMEYEPELGFSRIKIRFDDNVIVSVFANGTVVAQGKDLKGIENRVKTLLASYKNPFKGNSSKIPLAARKNLAKKRRNITEARYERAKNWLNSKPGFYVRPGPNKAPRFYSVPSNPALVRQKVMRAYANIGVNIPPLTRNILGIVSVPALKPKVVPKKTVSNWNASPPSGMYVRPGPGGLPKFYKIPKLKKQGKKTVLEAYRKAGVRIPNKVRNIFGISPSSPSSNKEPKLRGNINNKGRFRIDSLECMRYKLVDLKKIAERLDIPVSRRTKEQLCRSIRSKLVSSSSATPDEANFTKNGVKHYILANERKIKRGPRSKSMNSFKIDELKNFVSMMNSDINVSNKKKKNLIDILIERKRTKDTVNALFNNFNFSPSSKGSSPLSTASAVSSASSKGSPLSKGSPSPPRRNPLNIARDILGSNFTNKELQNFLNRYKKSPNSLNTIVKEFKNKKKTLVRMASANVETL